MINRRGFTLVELLITVAIMALVIALTGPVYTKLIGGVKEETVSSEVHQDLINGQELIRLDIEHTGVGIARNETNMPVIWNEGTKTIELRSTLNNTNQRTMGWALIDCTTAGLVKNNYIVNNKDIPNLTTMVLLKGYDPGDAYKNFGGLTTAASYATYACPATAIPEIYTAYPYDPSGGAPNFCGGVGFGGTNSWCTRISYLPSAAHGAPTSRAACAQGTFNLLRSVGNAAGDPIVNCVADFRVRVDIDTDGNGNINAGETDIDLSTVAVPATAATQMDTVKNIEFLLLVQAGQRDNDLNSNPNTLVSGVALSLAGIPAAVRTQYRWKVIKISGKPMSW